MSIPLEPDKKQREELSEAILSLVDLWHQNAGTMDASGPTADPAVLELLLEPPTEDGHSLETVLDKLDAAGQPGIYHPSGGHMSYIPNAGLYTGALADFAASGLNRYTGVSGAAPGMSAIEHGVIAWMLSIFGLGEGAGGILLSGGSLANFTAIVAARTRQLGDEFSKGVLYVSPHTHHSVTKSARLAGIPEGQIRTVDVDADLRIEPSALEEAVVKDRRSGLDPFLVVASAGTTDTGTVDPLAAISEIGSSNDLYVHVDAAYGGFFNLTDRGRATLAGLELADSITVDPHKGLSLPFGVGALLVRRVGDLIDANRGRGAYLSDNDELMGLRDIASLGPELTRPARGISVWLPLQIHGIAPFRAALDTSLDLAELGYERLRSLEGVDAAWKPDLSIVAFRFDDDDKGRRALETVNSDRRVHLSPTTIDGRFVLRLAILNRRSTEDHVNHAIDLIEKALG